VTRRRRRVGTTSIAAALWLGGLSVAACTSGDRQGLDGDGDGPSAAETLEIDMALARTSSVHIMATGCGLSPQVGGGGFVAPNVVITVAHVVAGSRSIDVLLADDTTVVATVVAIDRKKDLALLSVNAPQIDPIPTGTMQAGAQGAYSVRRDDAQVVLESTAVSFVDIDAPGIDDASTSLRRGYQLSAEVKRGDSGSVVVSGGKITAVIFATSTQAGARAWATDATEAAPLLRDLSTTPVDNGDCA
jgi:hypothetical protein